MKGCLSLMDCFLVRYVEMTGLDSDLGNRPRSSYLEEVMAISHALGRYQPQKT